MTTEIITLETVQKNALAVFTGESDALDILLKQIETEALSLVADVETKKGRDAIASNAYKVAQSKSQLEKVGKALADKQKEIPKLIDASRKKAKTFLDELQDKVRAPLTAYEQAEAQKEAERIAKIKSDQEAAEAERIYLLQWDEALIMNDRFDIDKEKAAIEAEKQRVKDEQEAKERAEREAKERAEREERIRQQAIAEQEEKQKQAIERAEREKKAAEQREKEALERAEREKQQAVEQEKARAKAEAERLQAIEEKRKADTAHRTAVKTAVKTALITKCGLSEQQAIDVVKAAIDEKLANLKINF